MKFTIPLALFLLIPFVASEITFFEGENVDFIVFDENINVSFYCGDLICRDFETCGSCEIDCGKCVVIPVVELRDSGVIPGAYEIEVGELENSSPSNNGLNEIYYWVFGGLLFLIVLIVYFFRRRR